MLIDNEKNFSRSEIENLRFQYENNNLSILLVSEWNNKNITKFISNTLNINSNETVLYDGSEVYSLNYFLENYGFELGEDSVSYEFYFNKKTLKVIKFVIEN